MASFMLRRIFQRSFSQTNFRYASSSPIVQRQTTQEDSKLNLKINTSSYSIDELCRYNKIEKRK